MLHYCNVHPTYGIFTSLGLHNLQKAVQILLKMYEAHFNPKLVNRTLSVRPHFWAPGTPLPVPEVLNVIGIFPLELHLQGEI